MYLYEAILLGRTLRPQCTHFFFDSGRSCANGAAMEAAGLVSTAEQMKEAIKVAYGSNRIEGYAAPDATYNKRFPIIAEKHENKTIGETIARKNNFGMTDAKICEWLKPIELAYYAEHPEKLPAQYFVKEATEQPEPACI